MCHLQLKLVATQTSHGLKNLTGGNQIPYLRCHHNFCCRRAFSSRSLWDRNEPSGEDLSSPVSQGTSFLQAIPLGHQYRKLPTFFTYHGCHTTHLPFSTKTIEELPMSVFTWTLKQFPAHKDLNARISIASHYQVFHLGTRF